MIPADRGGHVVPDHGPQLAAGRRLINGSIIAPPAPIRIFDVVSSHRHGLYLKSTPIIKASTHHSLLCLVQAPFVLGQLATAITSGGLKALPE